MNASSLRSIYSYLLIDPVETNKSLRVSPPQAQRKETRWHKVSFVGPGAVDLMGTPVPMEVKEGDIVYIMNHGKVEIDSCNCRMDKTEICSILDVMAKLNEDMTIQPLGNLIEIEKIGTPKRLSSGLEMPKGLSDPPNVGRVKSLGTGWRAADGTPIPFHVKEGDLVLFLPYRTMKVDMEQFGMEDRILISHGDILAVVS